MNTAAEAMLAPATRPRADAWATTVQAAHSGGSGAATFQISRGPHRRALLAYILPLTTPATTAFHVPERGRAAVFIADPEQNALSSLEIFARAHRLTPTEALVLERLAARDSTGQIARSLRIGMPTLRTHLHRLFEKTGTRRQAELVTLLFQSSLPLEPR